MSQTATPMVDVNVPRFNQALVALLTGAAFLLDQWWLVAVTFAVLAVSWLGGPGGAVHTAVRRFRPPATASGRADRVRARGSAPFLPTARALFLGAASGPVRWVSPTWLDAHPDRHGAGGTRRGRPDLRRVHPLREEAVAR
jgi:hypothetical protein